MYDWYDNLIEMMRMEKVEQAGHIQVLRNDVNELTELHFSCCMRFTICVISRLSPGLP